MAKTTKKQEVNEEEKVEVPEEVETAEEEDFEDFEEDDEQPEEDKKEKRAKRKEKIMETRKKLSKKAKILIGLGIGLVAAGGAAVYGIVKKGDKYSSSDENNDGQDQSYTALSESPAAPEVNTEA